MDKKKGSTVSWLKHGGASRARLISKYASGCNQVAHACVRLIFVTCIANQLQNPRWLLATFLAGWRGDLDPLDEDMEAWLDLIYPNLRFEVMIILRIYRFSMIYSLEPLASVIPFISSDSGQSLRRLVRLVTYLQACGCKSTQCNQPKTPCHTHVHVPLDGCMLEFRVSYASY